MTAVTSPAATGRHAELPDAAGEVALKLRAPEFPPYR
jgi:hypothetical protein